MERMEVYDFSLENRDSTWNPFVEHTHIGQTGEIPFYTWREVDGSIIENWNVGAKEDLGKRIEARYLGNVTNFLEENKPSLEWGRYFINLSGVQKRRELSNLLECIDKSNVSGRIKEIERFVNENGAPLASFSEDYLAGPLSNVLGPTPFFTLSSIPLIAMQHGGFGILPDCSSVSDDVYYFALACCGGLSAMLATCLLGDSHSKRKFERKFFNQVRSSMEERAANLSARSDLELNVYQVPEASAYCKKILDDVKQKGISNSPEVEKELSQIYCSFIEQQKAA